MDTRNSYGNSTNDSSDSNCIMADIPNSNNKGKAASTSRLESKTQL